MNVSKNEHDDEDFGDSSSANMSKIPPLDYHEMIQDKKTLDAMLKQTLIQQNGVLTAEQERTFNAYCDHVDKQMDAHLDAVARVGTKLSVEENVCTCGDKACFEMSKEEVVPVRPGQYEIRSLLRLHALDEFSRSLSGNMKGLSIKEQR
jgi:hypothetical protein